MIFAAGFLGSFHCIGMCGGFACALGRDPRGGAATVERHLLYNFGRLTTYCFLGALAGALGQAVSTAHGAAVPSLYGPLDTAQRVLAVVAGLLMIAMALQFFGLFHGFRRAAMGFGGSTLALSLRSLLATRSRAAPIALGVFNGFLPCPLVYAFAAQAASTGRAALRLSRHAGLRPRNLSRHADDGRASGASLRRSGGSAASGWPAASFSSSA